MSSLIVQTTSRVLQPLMLFVSVFLLLRGHNQPGGGFVGGLMATTAYALHMIAYGVGSARQNVPVETGKLFAIGLLLALAAGLAPMLTRRAFLTALRATVRLPVFGALEVGLPLLFDVGVYLVVLGASLSVLFAIEEE